MIFAVICAGGIGSRMGNSEMPKQYMKLGEKPIIIHTIEKFLKHPQIEKILVLCTPSWVLYTKELADKYIDFCDKLIIMEGGETRNDTIMRGISYMEEEFGLDDAAIVLTHDAVRPFVTERMIEENIQKTEKYGAATTMIPAVDTIMESFDGVFISSIPERKNLYQSQTPQTFRAKRLKELFEALTEEEKAGLTDASKIYLMKKEPIFMVKGEEFNFKITYPFDLKMAEIFVTMEQ